MGSAAVTVPPDKKYQRVYYITSAEHALSNIVFGRIKVARFSLLNDPFELLAPKFANSILRKSMSKFKREFDEMNGAVCFSGDWVDPVLWTHYGARHTGICLGFNLKRNILRKVKYVTERMTEFSGDSADQALEDAIIETKFASWKYENEHRILVPLENCTEEGRLHFLPFDNELQLAEVIIGAQSSLRSEELRRIVDRHYLRNNVTTFKAKLALKSFNIVPLEPSVPPVEITPLRLCQQASHLWRIDSLSESLISL
ncbi:DUF2971 domain-containing protein [Bradyrhizobium shewense]|nr:DUF2971 domain-containing protein [Bradyrhizobium shewense]